MAESVYEESITDGFFLFLPIYLILLVRMIHCIALIQPLLFIFSAQINLWASCASKVEEYIRKNKRLGGPPLYASSNLCDITISRKLPASTVNHPCGGRKHVLRYEIGLWL